MVRHLKRVADIGLAAVSIEGGLISPDQVAAIAATAPEQKAAAEYGCPKGTNLRDEVTRYFRIGQAHWQAYARLSAPNVDQTAAFVKSLLEEAFGFEALRGPHVHQRNGHTYRLTLEAKGGRVPVVVAAPVPDGEAFTKALPQLGDDHDGTIPRRSPGVLLQDWLNANPDFLWGMVFAGDRVRLMRDNASFTRPAYIEADLGAIFRDEMFADFTATWLLIHATRFGGEHAPAVDCALERWREAGLRAGTAARERLGESVEEALLALGQGFLDANPNLRAKLDENRLSIQGWFEQLLRVVYRLIFLAVSEDRDLLHGPDAPATSRDLYASAYGFGHMRERSARRSAHDHHHDAWEGAKIVFRGLERGERLLGLPPLGSLFARGQTPDLDEAKLPNRAFLRAVFHLSWLIEDGRRVRINWRDMATEELGSVYEGLLELVPTREDNGRRFCFAGGNEARGNARKISGSYYTPDSLVQTLLDNTLDPVLARAEAEGGADAILKLSVIDPACGSGHFLLGAARRMATRVALLRDSEAPDYPAAMRDVARHCIHGVDRNPMAVELAKVAMWIEAVEPGKPLTFLDSHIRCGDSLVGVFDLSVLGEGIPDDAYKLLNGDDREVVNYYKAKNRREQTERGRIESGFGFNRQKDLARDLAALADMPEETVDQIAEKRSRFETLMSRGAAAWTVERACDLWTSTFFAPKIQGGQYAGPDGLPRRGAETVATSGTVWELLRGHEPFGPLSGAVAGLAAHYRFFHWPIAFADVMGRGGFDVVLGNPPWETMSPDNKEFFASYDPQVRFMSPPDQRAAIEHLLEDASIAGRWDEHCRDLYAAVHFMKSSGRYRLFAPGNLGKGDFNVYRMFVESALALTRPGQVAAQFVPEGLYNGANATAIRGELFDQRRLEKLAGFENTKGIWFPSIDTRTKFCLYVAWRDGRTKRFGAAFRVNTLEKLANFSAGRVLSIPTDLVIEFSPDAGAVMEFAAQEDIDICTKMYGRFQKFGERFEGFGYRPYMREVDMGTDRSLFSEGMEGLPVFEGRMIDTYDYRAKGYVSGRGRSAVWEDYPFGLSGKVVRPQWRILPSQVPDKLSGRINDYRISFGDVGSPTNSRSMIASIVPPGMICGHTAPTIAFRDSDYWTMLLWVGVANSLAMDFIVRKKVALHLSYTVVDALPFPWDPASTPSGWDIVERVFKLCAVGDEMAGLRQAANEHGLVSDPDDVEEDPDRRAELAAEIDVLVAREVYGLNGQEMRYILDPASILGEECDIETFKALRNREMREFNEYRTQRLVLEAWDRLTGTQIDTSAIEAPRPPLTVLPDDSWTRPAQPQSGDIGAALAAILKAIGAPIPSGDVRLAAALILEPRLFVPLLTDAQATEWRRLVGAEADPLTGNVAAFATRNNAAWGAAVRNHRGNGRLIENLDDGTWAPGPGLDAIDTSSWPDGRAGFVLEALKNIDLGTAVNSLPDEIRRWIADAAAA
ncbi:MAG: type II DNA modification enzyme [Mesorhizobium sp.]|uniref:N-6 DNA methylase n=1 Tax=Mesorhizobium sp. TaxID=1871066 RepID=UPI00122674B0|nr:N-6 DNA methylase [Mesorhizobium sp.]TIL60520.1 MAG: type II DNA modification enzyme [Mesorhizobium sp.]